jgi:cytochrome c-type biogenesis protein CcmE
MRAARRRRLYIVILLVLGVGVAVAMALTAFNQNLMYFFTPTQVAKGEAPKDRAFRTGGLVKEGSVKREADGATVTFVITDTLHDTQVRYKGILPDLFREGQGIVANGRLRKDGVFVANEVLAKHDENYMPPEVADSLKQAGAMPPHEIQKSVKESL